MGIMEVVLLIIGGIIFILSFILPASKEGKQEENRELVREEIRELADNEISGIKSRVDGVVDETVGYVMEKTERSLERISNEKIMAINEYSDTVLEEINKNHQEVMFLYDMLNDKHNHLKKVISEVNQTVKEAEEKRKEAQQTVDSFQKLAPADSESVKEEEKKDTGAAGGEPLPPGSKDLEEEADPVGNDTNFQDAEEVDSQLRNDNDRILELYREGLSKVAIAQELGLGVGEVKLVSKYAKII